MRLLLNTLPENLRDLSSCEKELRTSPEDMAWYKLWLS